MFRRILLSWLVLAAAVSLVTLLLPGVHIEGGALTLLWISALYALLNVTLSAILALLTAPLVLLTLGLFTIVINAAMFELIDFWSDSLEIDSFWWALTAGLCVTVLTALLTVILRQVHSAARRERAPAQAQGISFFISSPCTITAQMTMTSSAIAISAHTG